MARAWAWLVGAAAAAAALAAGRSRASSPGGAEPEPSAAEPGTRAALRVALVKRAREDVGRVREQGGKNQGPEVNAYLRAVNEAPGGDWCAAALFVWLRDAAARVGVGAPFVGLAGAKATFARARAVARFVAPADMSPDSCPPGSIVLFDRSPGAPFSSWEGHIGVLSAWTVPGVFLLVSGNSGPTGTETTEAPCLVSGARLMGAAVL